jgi:peptidylprolyl isomerase
LPNAVPVASLAMRVRVPAVLALVAILASCGGGDDDDGAGDTDPSSAATTTIDGGTTSSNDVSTTIPLPHTSTTECEDAPDPADYPDGAIPQALRPCTAPTALAVHPIRTGLGRGAETGDTVIVDYTGVRSATGEMFDSSYLRGVPFDFVMGRGGVIAGWEQGLAGTQAGSLVKLDVPAELAYGDAPPSDNIQPGDALTFMIEVHAVIPPVSEADAPLELVVAPSAGATALGVVDKTVGEGAPVEAGDTAVVHMLLVRGDNLTVLLDTWKRRDPLQIIMTDGQSLPGVVDGLLGARVGGTRVLTLPPDLAFGPAGDPGLGLPAGVDLIVVAEVFGVY